MVSNGKTVTPGSGENVSLRPHNTQNNSICKFMKLEEKLKMHWNVTLSATLGRGLLSPGNDYCGIDNTAPHRYVF